VFSFQTLRCVLRESVLAALKAGLTADDIIGYLRSQAHPHVAAKSPVVPEVRAQKTSILTPDHDLTAKLTPVL
jgi:hypothetical protein